MSDYIHSAEYRAAREQKRREWKAQRRVCNICGQRINYDLPADDPMHFQLEHPKSRKFHPELERDPSNWAPAHAKCNKNKQAGPVTLEIGATSEAW